METKVTIYTTPTCPWCKKTKAFLKKHKIKYKGYNVKKDEKAREEMIEKSDQMGVPVIDINGKIFVGYDEKQLKKVLKIKE